MIIVNVLKYKSIEQALKVYKNKHNKIGITPELRDRQYYTKKSIGRREEVLTAIYKEQMYKR
jgi:small subunit ribosomal protein S21